MSGGDGGGDRVAVREPSGDYGFSGAGCLVQLLSIFVGLVSWWAAGGTEGMVTGIGLFLALFLAGQKMGRRKWRCGACRNPIASAEVSLCPSCHAEFRGYGGGGGLTRMLGRIFGKVLRRPRQKD